MMRRDFHKGAAASLFALQAGRAFAQSGYFLPDEAEPHERSFMQWPVSQEVYDDPLFLEDLQSNIAQLANTIAEFEPVVMLASIDFHERARSLLSENVELWDVPTDDLWARDSGPMFVKNPAGELAIQSLNFNGWGGKQSHEHDQAVAWRVAEILSLEVRNNGLVGEPGGVERAPDGVLMANRASWVNPNRNDQTEKEIEALLLDAFGGQKMIWNQGVYGHDITDDHIDATARFVSDRDVVIQLPPPSSDPFMLSAHALKGELENATNMNGEPYRLHILDEPQKPRIRSRDFVASYVNYYLCNGALIMAEFGDDEADLKAQEMMQNLYPSREIIALNVDAIGEVGGGIHCATQQQPKV